MRMKTRAEIKRTTAIFSIRAVQDLARRTTTESDLIPAFMASMNEIDTLWSQFKAEDESVLDCLVALNCSIEYSPDLPSEVRAVINECRAIADWYSHSVTESLRAALSIPIAVQTDSSQPHLENDLQRPLSRLPEISLPRFDGNAQYWPMFRDRFPTLVEWRSNISDVEKLYYLLGCLDGPAADAVRRNPEKLRIGHEDSE